MRKSVRRCKSRKRSRKKSKRKSRRKRSVRMRWISPGGTVHPNDEKTTSDARDVAGIVNSYNTIPASPHSRYSQYRDMLIKGWLKWNPSYLLSLKNGEDIGLALTDALLIDDDQMIDDIIGSKALTPSVWVKIVGSKRWSPKLNPLLRNLSKANLRNLLYNSDVSKNRGAAKAIINVYGVNNSRDFAGSNRLNFLQNLIRDNYS